MIALAQIMAFRLDGLTLSEIGAKFGVSRQHIGQLIYRDKKRARDRVRSAVKYGKLSKPVVCSDCGQPGKLQAHHADYSKPLDVTWLCFQCHLKHPTDKQRTPLNPRTRERLKGAGQLDESIYRERFAFPPEHFFLMRPLKVSDFCRNP